MTTAMIEIFTLFPFLPFEIRRHIYLLATQPRFVYVRENPDFVDEDRPLDAFIEFLESPESITTLQLHPSLTHFAHNWRRHVNWDSLATRPEIQTRLTSYGFTTNTKPYEPWTPTSETPEVPIHWLVQHPQLAFEFARKSYLYSRTAIPPLLHTCSESRRVLMRYGYTLSFATRTHGPRTWFCYRHDVLYLYPDDNTSQLLDGSCWNVGQFMPHDLRRVRHLALCFESTSNVDLAGVSNILRLFSGVRELFMVACNLNSRTSGWLSGDGELWHWIECDEADVWGALDRIGMGYEYDGLYWRLDHLKEYKRERDGDCSRYFEDWAAEWAEVLRVARDAAVETEVVAQWTIPKLRIVHVGSHNDAEILSKARDHVRMKLEGLGN